MVSSVLIIGASAAGVSAARTLRAEGFNKSIILIDADKHGSYERPPLSKALLQNTGMKPSDVALLSEGEARELNIVAKYGRRVTSLTAEGDVKLEDGEILSAAKIILATGGKARRLEAAGNDLAGIHVLRNFDDIQNIRDRLSKPSRIAVVGGGLIGAEVIASLNKLGHKVFWIDIAAKPLVHVMPEKMASSLLDWHKSSGVIHIPCANITKFESDDNKTVSAICFADEPKIQIDMVIIGVGITPDIKLAANAQLNIEAGGIAVDHNQQTSSDNIYAAGDVAAVKQADGTFKRYEHWQAAEHQGANAARAILKLEPLPQPTPWYWSDQGENHIEMTGRLGNKTIVRQEYSADGDQPWPVMFEMKDDELVGAVSINNSNAVRIAMRLIKSNKPVDAEQLCNPEINLRKLLRR